MAGRFELDRERKFAAPDPGQQFLARLDGALRPAMLLRFEAVHVHRQLGWGHYIRKKNEFPADELRAIAQIQIFRERVVLPAARFLDARAPPKTSRSVEIEKAAAPAAGGLLEQKMSVEKHRLHAREQRIAAIQMPPARLDHADFRVGEKMDRALEQVRLRNKISVENTDKLALC